MTLQYSKVAVLCAGLLAAATGASAAGPADAAAKAPMIRGFLNPQTGQFVAQPLRAERVETDAASLAASTVGGTLSFTFNITLKSGIPETTPIRCTAIASTRDQTFSETSVYYDSKSVVATRSGSTATCKISLFYSWLLPNPATTDLSMDYQVTVNPTTETGLQRLHMGSLATIDVPPNGTTTSRTVAVTL